MEIRLFHDKLPTKWDFLHYSGASETYTEKGKIIQRVVEVVVERDINEGEIKEGEP